MKRYQIKSIVHLLLALLVGATVWGCGDSQNFVATNTNIINNGGPTSATLNFTFTGAAAREISARLVSNTDLPSNTSSVTVSVLDPNTRAELVPSQTVERSGAASVTVVFDSLPEGDAIFLVEARDASNNLLAVAETVATITGVADVTATFDRLLTGISVSPSPVFVTNGGTANLEVTALFNGGATQEVVSDGLTFSSANDAVVSVSAAGVATGAAAQGATTVSAEYRGFTATVPASIPQTMVVSRGTDALAFYPENASGNTAAEREISGGATGLNLPRDLEVVGNEIFVANQFGNSITVFSTLDSGNATPTRTIAGGSTQLANPVGLVVNQSEIFVANRNAGNPGSILVFSANDDGDATPTREITGNNTGLMAPEAIFVTDTEIFVTDLEAEAVFVFPRAADGNVTPSRTLAGSNTLISGANSVLVSGNELFIGSNDLSVQLLVFPVTADGNVAPSRALGGPRSGTSAYFPPIISQNGELFVPDGFSLVVLDPNGAPNEPPIRTLNATTLGLNPFLSVGLFYP